MRSKNITKEVASKDNYKAIEKLPLPIVLYPGFYGAFFGFQEKDHSPILLCSCAREAIENYIQFRMSQPIGFHPDPARMSILDPMYFPRSLVENSPNQRDVMSNLRFDNRLCHECNRTVPSYRYCLEMYGSAFKQNYGWYINKQAYEFGIEPISNRIISKACPQEILDLVKLDPVETRIRYRELEDTDFDGADKLWKEYRKQERRIWKIIENEVRQKFGQHVIGEAWTSETILYYIVRSICPNMTVFRHYRPGFLEGMELDIFVQELNLGIEYQGIQHFKPVNHWGGADALNNLKRRDKRKKDRCASNGVHLVCFKYDETLSDDYVLAKIRQSVGDDLAR